MENQQTIFTVKRFKVMYWNPNTAHIMNEKAVSTYVKAQRIALKAKSNGFLYTIMELQGDGTKGGSSWKVMGDGAGNYINIASKTWEYRKPLAWMAGLTVLYRILFK